MKEKTVAARQSQVKTIIFLEANQRDFEELADNAQGLDVYFVDDYTKIFELAFGYDNQQDWENLEAWCFTLKSRREWWEIYLY